MSKSRRTLKALLVALTACFFSLPAIAQNQPVVIGGTLGLTGAFAGPSVEYKAVYDLWLADVNKRGGLLGREVKMTIYNDEGTPTIA